MSDFDIVSYLTSKGHQIKNAGGNEINTHCMFHGEDPRDRGRLYINTQDLVLHCKVCDERGHVNRILKHYGDEPIRYTDPSTSLEVRACLEDALRYYETKRTEIDFYGWCDTQRGLTRDTADRFRLAWAPKSYLDLGSHLMDKCGYDVSVVIDAGLIKKSERNGKYYDVLSEHIIIPYLERGRVMQLRGRDGAAPNPEHQRPKYRSLAGSKVRLFNADVLREGGDVVFVEGEFDAMVMTQLGYNAVTIAGANSFSESMAGLFADVDRVFLMMDADEAGSVGNRKVVDLLSDIAPARIVELPRQQWADGKPATDITDLYLLNGRADIFAELIQTTRFEASPIVTVDHAVEQWTALQDASGLRTGWRSLDQLIEPGWLPGQVVTALAGTGVGKAVTCVTPVLQASGEWTSMGDVEVGMELFSVDGTPTTVTGVYPQGELEVFDVTFTDGSTIQTCGEHLWETSTKNERSTSRSTVRSTTQIAQLLDDERPGHNRVFIPTTDPLQLPEADLPIDPWLLGAYLGDGHDDGRRLTNADPDVIAAYAAALPNGCELRTVDQYEHRIRAPHQPNNPLTDALRDFGLDGKRSFEKFIPDLYLRAAEYQRLAVLQGLLDTDGYTPNGSSLIEFVTTSPQLAADVQWLVESLGGTVTATTKEPTFTYKGETRRGRTAHRLYVRLPRDTIPYLHSERAGRHRTPQRAPLRRIVSIEPAGRAECVCISVDHPRRLFLIDHCIPTHNTQLLVNMAHSMTAEDPDLKILYLSLEQTAAEWFNRAMRIWNFHNLGTRPDDVVAKTLAYWRSRFLLTEKNRISPEELIISVEHFEHEFGTKPQVVMIDYLGYWARAMPGASEYEQLSNAIMMLKEIAKELKVVIVAPSQVSRGAERGKEPLLTAARGSGVIEETSDFLMTMWKPDDLHSTAPEKFTGELNIRLAKSRHGNNGASFTLQTGPLTLTVVDSKDSKKAELLKQEFHYVNRGERSWQLAIYRHATGTRTDTDIAPATYLSSADFRRFMGN